MKLGFAGLRVDMTSDMYIYKLDSFQRKLVVKMLKKIFCSFDIPHCLDGLILKTHWSVLSAHCLKLRCAGGREFNPRPGQYSRMSFSSDQVTGNVFSAEHAFPSKF